MIRTTQLTSLQVLNLMNKRSKAVALDETKSYTQTFNQPIFHQILVSLFR